MFKDLLESDLDAFSSLTDAVVVKEVDQGQNIIIEGEKGDTFYIILKG